MNDTTVTPDDEEALSGDENSNLQPTPEDKAVDQGEGDEGREKKTGPQRRKKDPNPEKRMPFLDHLEELRWTILRSLIAIVLSAIVCYFFSRQIVTFLRSLGPSDLKLIYLSPTEGFMIYIKVAIFSGLVLSLPYVAYEMWKFIVPGLLAKEKKLVPPIVAFTVLCFAAGAAFASFVIIPLGLRFLLSFQTDFLTANITIGKYLGFVVTLILVFGVVFELPVLSFFLTKIGILTPTFLSRNRRYGIVVIFIVAAVLTPPDIFTQLLLAAPLIMLYEVSIWVSKMVERKKVEVEERSED